MNGTRERKGAQREDDNSLPFSKKGDADATCHKIFPYIVRIKCFSQNFIQILKINDNPNKAPLHKKQQCLSQEMLLYVDLRRHNNHMLVQLLFGISTNKSIAGYVVQHLVKIYIYSSLNNENTHIHASNKESFKERKYDDDVKEGAMSVLIVRKAILNRNSYSFKQYSEHHVWIKICLSYKNEANTDLRLERGNIFFNHIIFFCWCLYNAFLSRVSL